MRRLELLRSRKTKKGPKVCSWKKKMREKNQRLQSKILLKSRGIHARLGSSTRTTTCYHKLQRTCLTARRWAGVTKLNLSTPWCRNPPTARDGFWTQSPQCLRLSRGTSRAWSEKRVLFPEFLLSCFFFYCQSFIYLPKFGLEDSKIIDLIHVFSTISFPKQGKQWASRNL